MKKEMMLEQVDLALVNELCHIYCRRNVLQRKRTTLRHRVRRADKRGDAKKLARCKKDYDAAIQRIKRFTAKYHKRTIVLTYLLRAKAHRTTDNIVRLLSIGAGAGQIRVFHDRFTGRGIEWRPDLLSLDEPEMLVKARDYAEQKAVEKMLKR